MSNMKLYSETLPDGRVQYRLRFLDPLTGKHRRISTIKPNNSRQNYNAALRELQSRADLAPSSRPKLAEALSLYLKDKKRELRPQTLIRNERGVRVVNEVLGDRYLDALTVMDIKRAISSCSAENCTYNERLARYKAFLRWCYQNELLQVDLASKLKPLPDNKRERIQDKYLEPEELSALLEGMKVPMWYYLTYFLALSGLRIGEAAALLVDDVGEDIDVTKTYSLVTYKVGPTKTGTSTRQVYIQPELRELLDDYMIFRAEYLSGKKTSLLFPSKQATYLNYRAYDKYLAENSERILGRIVTPHALRHTSASLLIANGVPLETVSRRLGHSNSKVTREIYLHLTEKIKEADNRFISQTRLLP